MPGPVGTLKIQYTKWQKYMDTWGRSTRSTGTNVHQMILKEQVVLD